MTRRQWALVLAASAASGLVWLSVSEITVALPEIQRDLDASLAELQWISSVSFTLTLTALLVAGGRLGDLFGHRRVLGAGLLVFSILSVVCAVVPSATVLIIARGGQGVGAAMLITTGMALIANRIPSEVRGLALGVFGGASTIMQGLGPLVGGAFASLGAWQLVFWANLPIAAACWLVLVRVTPNQIEPGATRSLDVRGIATLAGAAGAGTLVLINGPTWGWMSTASIVCYAATIVSLAAFIVRERRASAPLVEFERLRNPLLSGAIVLLFLTNLALVAVMFLLALHFQNVLGYSAFVAGVLFLPITAMALFAGPGVGRAFDRFGPRWPNVIAATLTAVGTIAVALAVSADSYWYILPGLLVFGVGATAVVAAAGASVVQAVPAEFEGAAAGMFAIGATLASTLGLALAGPIFAGVSQDRFDRDVAQAGLRVEAEPGEVIAILSRSAAGREAIDSVPPERRAEVTQIAKEASRDGASVTLLVFGLIAAAGVPVAYLTQRERWFDARNARAVAEPRAGPAAAPATRA